MKITKRQLRRLVREERFRALLSEASPEIESVGDLKAAIAAASGKKRDAQGKAALKDFGKGFLADLFPPVAAAKSIHDLLKSTYTMDDEARTGTALDYLDVDDNISAIVDNPIETKFLNALAKEVEAMSDDTPLEDLNMTNLLSRYLKGEFNQRTVAGFEEGKKLKITERQLRRIISEQFEEPLPPLTPDQDKIDRLLKHDVTHALELAGTLGMDPPEPISWVVDQVKRIFGRAAIVELDENDEIMVYASWQTLEAKYADWQETFTSAEELIAGPEDYDYDRDGFATGLYQ